MTQTKIDRQNEIDLIKFIACIMIVILHSISPSEDSVHELVYLSGCYGVPLFFMTNGYLRVNKEFTFKFTFRIILRYIRFIAASSIIVGVVKLILFNEVDFLGVFMGAFVGRNSLYHLWFLSGLIILYLILSVINGILSSFDVCLNNLASKQMSLIIVCVLLNVVFAANIVLKKIYGIEIRDIVIAPLRIVTNGSYFFLGMAAARFKKNIDKFRDILIIFIMISFFVTFKTTQITGMFWASSYYPFFGVTIGTILIFMCVKNLFSNSMSIGIERIVNTNTGVWLLHPFIIKALFKMCSFCGFEQATLIIRLIVMLLTVVLCVIFSLVINRVKWVSWIINP